MASIRLTLLIMFASGCAYGYAGQEGKTRAERQYKPTVKVVTVEEAPDDEPEEETKNEEPAAVESPCGTPTFEIFYYSSSSKVQKTIDCSQRTVVRTNETTLGEAAYASAQSSGLPESSWYVLVDPKGVRSEYLNNAQLLKLSRQFTIEYFGRDAARDLLVYLYQDEAAP